MTNNETTELDAYQIGIIDLASLINQWGAKAIWQDLKKFYPVQYRELLIRSLEELPK